MEKIIIENRKEQRIMVLLEKPEQPKGLAFVMHGLSGNKEEPHIITFAESFREKNYTVVRFDTTNTFGESDGKYEDATLTNYYEDLEDVIAWSKKQSWFVRPFCLTGHSFGGIATILYAEKHPDEIKGLAPISTVVSGKLSLESPKHKKILEQWKKTRWREEASKSVQGRIKRLPWSHMVDRLRYDVLPKADRLRMPVLLIVGDKDDSTPLDQQQLLYRNIPGKKELHIINGAPHTFVQPSQLAEIKQIFLKWIDML